MKNFNIIKSIKITLTLSVLIFILSYSRLQAVVVDKDAYIKYDYPLELLIKEESKYIEEEEQIDEQEIFDEIQLQNDERELDINWLLPVKAEVNKEVIEDDEEFNEDEIRELSDKLLTELLFV